LRIHLPEEPGRRLSDAWRCCVGTGRFELALRRDYQDSLALIQREIGFRYIRGHGVPSDGVGVVQPYEYRGERHVRYGFTYVDQVIDAYLELGIAPFIELGFMPTALASGTETVFWWGGNITPPRSWRGWARLGPGNRAAPRRPVPARPGPQLADRGVERTQPRPLLARRRSGRLPPAVRGDGADGEGGRRLVSRSSDERRTTW
jgi:hypothetical protein